MGHVDQAGRVGPAGRVGRRLGGIAAIALLAVLLAASDVFAQCAMCRRALASPEGQQMVAAFRSGILILLAAPFAAFAVVARLAMRMDRLRRKPDEREG